MASHDKYLQRAIDLAAKGVEEGGRPFGAVIVYNGEVIAEAINSIHLNGDPTAHAELNAIRAVAANQGSSRLKDCVVYASGQPCPMCLAAMHLNGMKEVYFANTNEDGEPFSLSTGAVYQQMRKPLNEQSISIHHCPQPDGVALYQRWADKASQKS